MRRCGNTAKDCTAGVDLKGGAPRNSPCNPIGGRLPQNKETARWAVSQKFPSVYAMLQAAENVAKSLCARFLRQAKNPSSAKPPATM